MAYLSVEQYLGRYGEQEAILLTNEDAETPTPTYDSAKVQAAIDAAEEEADGYIGTRYALPLLTVPPILKSIVGPIARATLHNTRVPQDVRDDAALARSQLKDIAAGRLTLPVPLGGSAPVVSPASAPMRSNDAEAPTFSQSSMVDYMAPFNQSQRGACWRNGQ